MIARASDNYRAALLVPAYAGGMWHRLDVEPPKPGGPVHSSLMFDAFINDGRWIAQCLCGGAQLVTRDEPLFFCNDCAGERHDGKWVRVLFPRNMAAIEAEVDKRRSGHKHWRPDESLADVRKSNAAHGVK